MFLRSAAFVTWKLKEIAVTATTKLYKQIRIHEIKLHWFEQATIRSAFLFLQQSRWMFFRAFYSINIGRGPTGECKGLTIERKCSEILDFGKESFAASCDYAKFWKIRGTKGMQVWKWLISTLHDKIQWNILFDSLKYALSFVLQVIAIWSRFADKHHHVIPSVGLTDL